MAVAGPDRCSATEAAAYMIETHRVVSDAQGVNHWAQDTIYDVVKRSAEGLVTPTCAACAALFAPRSDCHRVYAAGDPDTRSDLQLRCVHNHDIWSSCVWDDAGQSRRPWNDARDNNQAAYEAFGASCLREGTQAGCENGDEMKPCVWVGSNPVGRRCMVKTEVAEHNQQITACVNQDPGTLRTCTAQGNYCEWHVQDVTHCVLNMDTVHGMLDALMVGAAPEPAPEPEPAADLCAAVTCAVASSTCKVAGGCCPIDGTCTAEADAADGTSCDDGDAQTEATVCTDGECGKPPVETVEVTGAISFATTLDVISKLRPAFDDDFKNALVESFASAGATIEASDVQIVEVVAGSVVVGYSVAVPCDGSCSTTAALAEHANTVTLATAASGGLSVTLGIPSVAPALATPQPQIEPQAQPQSAPEPEPEPVSTLGQQPQLQQGGQMQLNGPILMAVEMDEPYRVRFDVQIDASTTKSFTIEVHDDWAPIGGAIFNCFPTSPSLPKWTSRRCRLTKLIVLTLGYWLTLMNFVFKMMNFVFEMMNFALK